MHVECGTGELSAAGDAAAVVTRALSLSGLGILKNINKRGEDSSKVKRGGKERTGAPMKGRRCRLALDENCAKGGKSWAEPGDRPIQ